MSPADPSDADQVVLDVPALPRSLRLLRLAAADAAADLEFDVDAVESARIAVDELASLLLATGSWARLRVTLAREDGVLRVEGTVTGPAGRSGATRPVQIDRVVEELLTVCVDEFRVSDDGPAFTFTLGKNGAEPR